MDFGLSYIQVILLLLHCMLLYPKIVMYEIDMQYHDIEIYILTRVGLPLIINR